VGIFRCNLPVRFILNIRSLCRLAKRGLSYEAENCGGERGSNI
jgi:hypothetical protein